MDSVWNHSATGDWKFIPIKRGSNGVGKVTGEYASQIIEQAENDWLGQLSDEQIAFGIALMNVESGFNPKAAYSGPLKSRAFGLGQFQPDTWEEEVAKYNQNNTEKIDPVADKWNAGAQIKILGQWIDETLWPKAEQYKETDLRFDDYSLFDVAYGLHNRGQNSSEDRVYKFLDSEYQVWKLDKWINNVANDVNNYFNGVEFDFYYNGACQLMPYNSAWSDVLNPLRSLFSNGAQALSPVVLDLDKDGVVETTALADGAYFDHDANGFAEQTGWAGSDDGILVRDINGNGTIDNGKELFGSETILNNGSKASNGFQALSELDSNSDGKVDINDSSFSQLKIWQDKSVWAGYMRKAMENETIQERKEKPNNILKKAAQKHLSFLTGAFVG